VEFLPEARPEDGLSETIIGFRVEGRRGGESGLRLRFDEDV